MCLDEIIDFAWDNYLKIHNKVTKEQFSVFLRRNKDKIIIGENPIGIALYCRLFDETFEKIKSKELDITIPMNIEQCLQENGDNLHFILLITKGMKIIRQGLRDIIIKENPRTVSWFSSDMKNLFIKNVR